VLEATFVLLGGAAIFLLLLYLEQFHIVAAACRALVQGSWSPGSASPGGANFYAYPYAGRSIGSAVHLQYEVYFDPSFDFVKGVANETTCPCCVGLAAVHNSRGGRKCRQAMRVTAQPLTLLEMSFAMRLPALLACCSGGKLPGLNGCRTGVSGGNHSDDGFSVRLMWRRNGDGKPRPVR
jgi:hypothetical protein